MLDAGEHEALSASLLTDLAGRIAGPHRAAGMARGQCTAAPAIRSVCPTRSRIWATRWLPTNKLERAKEVFEQLVDREPDSEPAKRKLNDVLRRMGLITPESRWPSDDNLKTDLEPPAAPKVRPDLDATCVSEFVGRADAEHSRRFRLRWMKKPKNLSRSRSPTSISLPVMA